MKIIFYISGIISFVFLMNAQTLSNKYKVDTLCVNNNSEITLTNSNIFINTIYIMKGDSSITDYEIDYNPTKIKIVFNKSSEISPTDSVLVFYKEFPVLGERSFRRREIQYYSTDTTIVKTVDIKKRQKLLSNDNIFGKGIQKSGSISRGFSVGTNKDFSVNSGLNLQLSGKLSEDIEIIAALTDQNTPIQPDGNTETLEELDQVFIQVKHKNIEGTFGDIDYSESIGEFGVIKRKLKGLQAKINYGNTSGAIVIASARGKFTTNSITGIDGVQGPYRLFGENNEKNIIIIAGSEKVFLDGIELKRGENNDYTIDYSTAELYFTPERLITSASRISIDFEYTDRQYQRNYLGTNIQTDFFDKKLSLAVSYFQETDDHENPVDLILDDEDKTRLELAGDDRTKAAISGVKIAEADSMGNIQGTYTKVDTLINGNEASIYRFLPGEETSIYNVTFSYVGVKEGDYIKEGLGNYKFVGFGNGNYMPIRYLPLPTLKRLGNIVINSTPLENLKINFELAGSIYDENRFSTLDNDNNNGFARKLEINYLPTEIVFGNTNIGKYGISVKDRFVDSNFNPLNRIDDVEFQRHYNIQGVSSGNEHLSEVNMVLIPVEELNINSSYGRYKKGSEFISNRYLTDVKYLVENTRQVNYKFDYVKSTVGELNTDWIRQNSESWFRYGDFKVSFNFLHEDKREEIASTDSLLNSSLRYLEFTPGLQFVNTGGISISAIYSYREESFPINGKMLLASKTNSQGLQFSHKSKINNSNVQVAIRNKKFTDEFKTRGFSNNETILIKSHNSLTLGRGLLRASLFYEASTEKSSKLEKVFIRVPQGTGNYKYLGDLNNNGIAEENEFEPTIYDGDFIATTYPTDELFPVVDLKFNTRLSVNLSNYFSGNSFLNTLLRSYSSETAWRIDENSKEEDIARIYLLNLGSFQNDSTTIRGSNVFTHDIYFNKTSRKFSLRLRYNQKRNMNGFNTGIEKGFYKERSLRLKIALIKEITNQTEFINKNDFVNGPSFSNRNRELFSNEITTDFSYRPIPELELGFKFKTGNTTDSYPETATEIDFNSQLIRFNYSFLTKGKLRLEIERLEFVTNSANYIPFEITQGNVIGKNYICSINFDYNIGTNLQTTVNYVGRFQGSGKVINTMRAEARAFF